MHPLSLTDAPPIETRTPVCGIAQHVSGIQYVGDGSAGGKNPLLFGNLGVRMVQPAGNSNQQGNFVQPASVARFFLRSEEHTSELQSLMRISYAVCCLNKKQKSDTEQQWYYK